LFAKKNPDNKPVKAYDVVIECIVYDDEAIIEVSQKKYYSSQLLQSRK
jgi:hypothetical protein